MVPRNHHQHVVRILLLFFIFTVLFFVIRAFLIPKSFGELGHFRADNIKEQAEIPIVHGAPTSCLECHAEEGKMIRGGPHVKVPCQDCHGPLTQHVTEEGIQPMPIIKSYALCARCHQKLDGRPAGFPQINFREHVGSKGKTLENEEICFTCHLPHNPLKKK